MHCPARKEAENQPWPPNRNSATGDEIAGYTLESLVGRGGMGEVFRAVDGHLARAVALKVLAPGLVHDEASRDRILRESQLAASIDHPNVIPVYAAGEADGHVYIAMRLVEGSDLRSVLRRDGRLEPARAIALVAQVASALDAAHARGLVHRDVKPSNVLIDSQQEREHCYLADFGITTTASDLQPVDVSQRLLGTLAYVAPEQVRGDPVDARADVYSLGCLLFECLTGEVPFVRDSDIAVVFAHLEEPPPRPSERVGELPSEIDAVIARALAKQPEDRYETCGELVDDARRALGLDEPRRPRRGLALALAGRRAGGRRGGDRGRGALGLGACGGADRIGRPHRSGERIGEGDLPALGASGSGRRRPAGLGDRLPAEHALAHRSAYRRADQHRGDRQPARRRDPRRARVRRQRRPVGLPAATSPAMTR